ncbi:CAAX prenyl protease-related protein [Luteolibacter pohnpeiensis]|uniref:CAAX prenyl protease-related protein n=1 Tax=Luteolibacter pohnpeiensis TaxID=454153 RepID=A0A934S9E5_9BACT|nr:CAAX prenyl protease-related protein [Luteolibacter pohnpeiensis]MBK1884248.1 CAAX prenyl protease-related protein [Luteolibacter pohnpeiensis]
MKTNPPANHDTLTRAHVVPFAVFMGFLIVLQIFSSLVEWKHPAAPWWRQDPAQLIYPIQTLVTLGALIYYRRYFKFDWSPKWIVAGILFGAVGIGFWLLPTTLYDAWGLTGKTDGWMKWLGVAERKDGFNPGIFHHPAAYWTSLIMRFFRAAVIVALVEEIFWRGFLMRFVCDWEGNYWKQPFGRATWRSYLIVTGLFILAHAPVDYAGALVYGSLTYLLCVWSKSLGACVMMHATANFLMGWYAMAYGKFGLW